MISIEKLNSMSREEAATYLAEFKVKELKEFANTQRIPVGTNKASTIDKLIENTAGLRLRTQAIRNLNLSVKSRG